jgi:hypothetical protein
MANPPNITVARESVHPDTLQAIMAVGNVRVWYRRPGADPAGRLWRYRFCLWWLLGAADYVGTGALLRRAALCLQRKGLVTLTDDSDQPWHEFVPQKRWVVHPVEPRFRGPWYRLWAWLLLNMGRLSEAEERELCSWGLDGWQPPSAQSS